MSEGQVKRTIQTKDLMDVIGSTAAFGAFSFVILSNTDFKAILEVDAYQIFYACIGAVSYLFFIVLTLMLLLPEGTEKVINLRDNRYFLAISWTILVLNFIVTLILSLPREQPNYLYKPITSLIIYTAAAWLVMTFWSWFVNFDLYRIKTLLNWLKQQKLVTPIKMIWTYMKRISLLTIGIVLVFMILFCGLILYIVLAYFGKTEPPGFELAIVSSIFGGLLSSNIFLSKTSMNEETQVEIKRIGIRYLIATIGFVLLTLYLPIGDTEPTGLLFWIIVVIVSLSMVGSAFLFAFATAKLLRIIPQLWRGSES